MLTFVICRIELESLSDQALRDTTAVIDFAQEVSHPSSLLLMCDTKRIFKKAETSRFRNAVLEERKGCLQQENIHIGLEACFLQTRISDKLEEKITDGFLKISSFLQRFEADDNIRIECTGNVIKSDGVVKTIQDFLLNFQRLKDLTNLTNGRDTVEETFTYRIIHHLCHEIRCAAVPPLAKKYNQQPWVCNILLHEIEFEEALVDSISRNTRHHLSKIENALNENKNGKFVFILYPLQEDMKSTFEDAEKKFAGMQRLSLITRKMLFEAQGYIKQTKSGLADVAKKETVQFEISDDLRDDLFSVNGVYGIGTIYGKLEVHLDLDESKKDDVVFDEKDNTKQTEIESKSFNLNRESTKARYDYGSDRVSGKLKGHLDESLIAKAKGKQNMQSDKATDNRAPTEVDIQNSKIEFKNAMRDDDDKNIYSTHQEKATIKLETVKNEIEEQLKKHRYFRPYTVKCVTRKAEISRGLFEPGDQLLSPTKEKEKFTFGTLGGYVISKTKTLYGLTCLHVIGTDGKVYTDNGDNRKKLFGNYQKGMENVNAPFIDIAAVEVTPTLQEKYKNYLEQAMTRITKVKVSHEKTNDLIGRYVYKFGAATGVTKGTIMCVDYTVFDPKARNYIIIIDPLAADEKLNDFSDVFTSLRKASSSNVNQADTHASNVEASNESSETNYQRTKQVPLSHSWSSDTKYRSDAQCSASKCQSDASSPDSKIQSDSQSASGECQSVARFSDTESSANEYQFSDTERQLKAGSLPNECLSVKRFSENHSPFDTQSSDNESQCASHSSGTQNQAVTSFSDIEGQSNARSSATNSQYFSRIPSTKSIKLTQCSDIEKSKTTNVNKQAAHSLSNSRQQFNISSNNTRHTVSKPSDIGNLTIFQSYPRTSQTLTETVDSDIAKSKPSNGNAESQSLFSKQKVIELLQGINDHRRYNIKIDQNGFSNTMEFEERSINDGQNETQIERNPEYMNLKTTNNMNEPIVPEVSRFVDNLDLSYEIQESGAGEEMDAAETCAKKQMSRTPPQELNLTDEQVSYAEKRIHCYPDTFIYVRDIHNVDESDETKSRGLKSIFSTNGDSGAIICTPDPSSNGLTCLAVSMLTSGDLKIKGHHGSKSLSIRLTEGLEIICKQCDLEFETFGNGKKF